MYAINRKRYPEHPWLTEESIRLLDQWLRPSDIGVEWGAGNSTRWFAQRTKHLTSFETNPDYVPVVQHTLDEQRLNNVALNYLPFERTPDENDYHQSEWLHRARALPADAFDYALIDSAPRHCLCLIAARKLRNGGVLILDNANWYTPPPRNVSPFAPSSVTVPLGDPASKEPNNQCWPEFERRTKSWRRIWTTDGVTMTLILFKGLFVEGSG